MKKIKNKIIKLFKKIPRKILFPVLIVVILVSLMVLFKNQLIVAMINGKPISRLTLIKELEKQGKKQVLENLIIKTLILQEAQKQKLTISEEEIKAEISKIENSLQSSGQTLDQVLQAQGMSLEELKQQISLQKIVEKMAGKDITISEEEIKKYQQDNKDYLPKDKTAEEIKEQITQQLQSEKLNQKMEELIQKLREQAKIKYF